LALTIPAHADYRQSPLHKLEDKLHFWVVFVIMPLFALANAGFSLEGLTLKAITNPIVSGITLGLFLGKQTGVFLFSYMLIKLKFARLPDHTTWPMLYGVSLLCGIGFTMSLFLGTLSFPNETAYLTDVRLGVILGSFLSSLFGAIVLVMFTSKKKG
jgi:NhaA family Na+:H+ antiporter